MYGVIFILLALAGCASERHHNDDSFMNEYSNEESENNLPAANYENDEPAYFNLPTIESPYPFRVRYFRGGRHIGDSLFEVNNDFYADERRFLWFSPNEMESSWRPLTFDTESHYIQHITGVRVATSVDELANPSLTEYDACFFESNYLVVINMLMPNTTLDDLIHQIDKNGVIQMRPNMTERISLFNISRWTVIIELDIRFQPLDFNVVFIHNPWAVDYSV